MRAGSGMIMVALLGLAGCATPTTLRPELSTAETKTEIENQRAYVVRARAAEEERVQRVVDRLFAANRDLCPDKRPFLGLNAKTVLAYSADLQPAARSVLSLGDSPQLVYISEGSPAARAGLLPGDVVLAVEGEAIAAGPKSMDQLSMAMENAAQKPETPVHLSVLRNGVKQDVVITPSQSCAYRVALQDSDEINAYADGAAIYITRGILRFSKNDDELALIVGHELAHNTEHHTDAKKKNAALAGLGGLLLDVAAAYGGVDTKGAYTNAAMNAGQNFASPEFESEADYVGMYFAARAGYSIDNVGDFWRRMSVEYPKSIYVKTTHPANAQRYVAINAAAKEIHEKQAAKMELLPNRQPKSK